MTEAREVYAGVFHDGAVEEEKERWVIVLLVDPTSGPVKQALVIFGQSKDRRGYPHKAPDKGRVAGEVYGTVDREQRRTKLRHATYFTVERSNVYWVPVNQLGTRTGMVPSALTDDILIKIKQFDATLLVPPPLAPPAPLAAQP